MGEAPVACKVVAQWLSWLAAVAALRAKEGAPPRKSLLPAKLAPGG